MVASAARRSAAPAIAFVDVFADLHAACVRWHGEDVADRDEMWRALQRLPHQQRVAVVLRYYEGLSVAETAAVLGVREGTVKSNCSRGLARLEQVLTGEGAGR